MNSIAIKVLVTALTILIASLTIAHPGHGPMDMQPIHYLTSFWHLLPTIAWVGFLVLILWRGIRFWRSRA